MPSFAFGTLGDSQSGRQVGEPVVDAELLREQLRLFLGLPQPVPTIRQARSRTRPGSSDTSAPTAGPRARTMHRDCPARNFRIVILPLATGISRSPPGQSHAWDNSPVIPDDRLRRRRSSWQSFCAIFDEPALNHFDIRPNPAVSSASTSGEDPSPRSWRPTRRRSVAGRSAPRRGVDQHGEQRQARHVEHHAPVVEEHVLYVLIGEHRMSGHVGALRPNK